MPLKSIHVAANGNISFFVAEQYSTVYIYPFSVHSSVDGHLGCFRALAIVSDAAVNFGEQVSFWISVFCFLFFFFRYIPRSRIVWWGYYSDS